MFDLVLSVSNLIYVKAFIYQNHIHTSILISLILRRTKIRLHFNIIIVKNKILTLASIHQRIL